MLAKPTGEMGFPKENEYFTSIYAAGAAAKSLQSCPTLCSPIDGSPPGSPIPGILQVRTLEWVALSFSNAWKWKVKVKLLSRFWLLATPWTAAYQAPPSMGFSRQEYWSGLPLPSLPIYARKSLILRQEKWCHLKQGGVCGAESFFLLLVPGGSKTCLSNRERADVGPGHMAAATTGSACDQWWQVRVQCLQSFWPQKDTPHGPLARGRGTEPGSEIEKK